MFKNLYADCPQMFTDVGRFILTLMRDLMPCSPHPSQGMNGHLGVIVSSKKNGKIISYLTHRPFLWFLPSNFSKESHSTYLHVQFHASSSVINSAGRSGHRSTLFLFRFVPFKYSQHSDAESSSHETRITEPSWNRQCRGLQPHSSIGSVWWTFARLDHRQAYHGAP